MTNAPDMHIISLQAAAVAADRENQRLRSFVVALDDEIMRLRKRIDQLIEISAVEINKRDDEIERLEAEAREVGKREVAAWSERDQYLQTNVKLLEMIERLRRDGYDEAKQSNHE